MAVKILCVAGLVAGCTASPSGHDRSATPASSSTTVTSRSPGESGPTADPARLVGALRGLSALDEPLAAPERRRLVAAADRALHVRPRPRARLVISSTDDPFVSDALAAWTLALAGRVTGDVAYQRASAQVVWAWVATTRRLGKSCAASGSCSTSLMVSRAAPALVFTVDLLVAAGTLSATEREEFHRWIRTVVLPAASDRENNWGDAGTFLRAVVGAELGDRRILASAAHRWRQRVDLVAADGRIPEEIRRGNASLMYSQEALDYKVATADVLSRSGIDVWSYRGGDGGTVERSLQLVATGLADPSAWPGGEGDLRVPDPSGVWAIAASRWPSTNFDRLARRAASGDGRGHSAVIWTGVTHPVVS